MPHPGTDAEVALGDASASLSYVVVCASGWRVPKSAVRSERVRLGELLLGELGTDVGDRVPPALSPPLLRSH